MVSLFILLRSGDSLLLRLLVSESILILVEATKVLPLSAFWANSPAFSPILVPNHDPAADPIAVPAGPIKDPAKAPSAVPATAPTDPPIFWLVLFFDVNSDPIAIVAAATGTALPANDKARDPRPTAPVAVRPKPPTPPDNPLTASLAKPNSIIARLACPKAPIKSMIFRVANKPVKTAAKPTAIRLCSAIASNILSTKPVNLTTASDAALIIFVIRFLPIALIILSRPSITLASKLPKAPSKVSVLLAASTAPLFIPNCVTALLNSLAVISPLAIASRKLPV